MEHKRVLFSEFTSKLKIAVGIAFVHWLSFLVWFFLNMSFTSQSYNWGLHIFVFPMVFKVIIRKEIKSVWIIIIYSVALSLLFFYILCFSTNRLVEEGGDVSFISMYIFSIVALMSTALLFFYERKFYYQT